MITKPWLLDGDKKMSVAKAKLNGFESVDPVRCHDALFASLLTILKTDAGRWWMLCDTMIARWL